MEAIKTQVGFSGTLAEFFTFLRTDPRFFYKTGPELLEAYRAMAKRVDPGVREGHSNAASPALWRHSHP